MFFGEEKYLRVGEMEDNQSSLHCRYLTQGSLFHLVLLEIFKVNLAEYSIVIVYYNTHIGF